MLQALNSKQAKKKIFFFWFCFFKLQRSEPWLVIQVEQFKAFQITETHKSKPCWEEGTPAYQGQIGDIEIP